ncbi:MAG: HYR domain-containing protein, partial [Bacteroidetes bacterium]|nr:HYR domain-containing protein [Bacteroidota bacterium]
MKARTAARAVPRGRWRFLPVLGGLLLAPSLAHAQAPDGWRWSTDVSAPGLDAALDVAADTSSQAVYTVGYVEKTSGLLDILLSLLLGSQYGGLDGFIAKYDADGIRQWSFLIGGTADDACTGVCVGPDGKIYVTGHFSGNATFGGGANLTSAGGKDIFVACYAADGTLQWKVRGGGAGDDLATSIAFRAGKLFVTGSFTGTATIAGAASATGLDPARRNTFIAAFRASDGAGLWRVDGGNASDSELNGICTDADRVYAIGRFKGTTYRLSTSAGALGTALTTPAGRDNNGFVAALQQDGSFAWSVAISDAAGSDGTYRANGIGASPTGVFITGSSHNGTTFPGSVTVNATGNPHDYAYVARLNRNTGSTTWVRTMRSTGGGGSDHEQAGRDLVVDRNGDVCITGSFRASIEFPNGTTATGTSDAQVFLAKFGSTGLFKWGLSAPGNHDDLANGIDSDGHAHLAVAGAWNDRILFDTELNGNGGNNLFLAQLTDINFEVAAYRDPSRWNGFGPLCASDAPVDLTTTYIPAQAGAGIAVQSSSGIATPEGALGLNPGGQAIFDTNGDQLVIDFGNTIPAGEHVLMRWLRTGGGTATAQVEVSPDAVTFTSAGTYQTGQGTYAITSITVPVPMRYIRIRRVASGATFWVDGVFDDLGTEPGGVWSGPGVSGTTFTPTGLSGAIDLTYTVGTRSTTRSITVHPPSNAGTITGGGIICPNTAATFALSGHTGATIAWGVSTNGGGNWSSTTTNASTFTLNSVAQPTQVRATVTSGTCPAATTAAVTVTPQDITPPTLSGCPGNITVNAIPGECRAVVSYTLPTVTDDCTAPITAAPVDPAHVSGGTFLVGTTTVVLQATDATGNTGSCSFTITVVDDAPPTITCPVDLNVPADAGACGAVVGYALPTAADNCSAPLTVQPTDNAYAPGSFFPVGMTTVQFRATDAAGNSGTCSFNVMVVDAQPPAITCPGDISVPADAGSCGAVVSYAMPTAVDGCSGSLAVQPVDPARAPGAFFPLGTTTVQLLATDAADNNGTCSFNVTVTDTQAPQFSCPGDITVLTTPGLCGATVTYAMPAATDNCSGTVNVTAVNGASGTFFPAGTTLVTLSATDAAGNTSTCSFHVTVTDTEAPVVSGCADQLVEVQAPNACGAVVNYPAITATDNCGGTLPSVRTAGPASGSLFPFGTTTIVHQATHGAQTGSCSFNVTVVDKAPPSFALVPGPTLLLDASCTAIMPDLASLLTGLADCSGLGPIAQTPAMGTPLTGTTSATITVGDALGNDTTVQVTVTVADQTPPQITCPGPISVALPMGQCSTQVFIPRPTISDNCNLVALTDSTGGIGSGSWFVPGTHAVTYTATDAANNLSSCQMSVSVLPQPAVDLAYPSTTYCADDGTVLPSVHQPTGGVFACVDAGLVLDASSGALDPATSAPGTYTVTYTFAGPCSTQGTFTLSIAPAPDAGTDGTVTLCSSAPSIDLFATLGGTPQAGGTWSGPAPTTGAFDPATLPGGTYVYTVNGAAACASRSASVMVTVVHEADATFSYPQGTYCAAAADPTPVTAQAGGTFSASAGLTIDATTGTIDLDASAPGTYAITHAFDGQCPSSDTFALQIDAPASANAGPDVHVCGLSAALGASGTGVWSAPSGITVAAPTDAASSVSSTVGGTYALTWSVSNGTCSATDDVTVTLDAPVAADAGDDQQVCGLNTVLAGEGNGTWNAPSGIAIDDPANAVS